MPWIKPIVATFEAVPPDDPYNRYMGSWNKLLNLLFPPSTPFSVSPQYSFPNNNMAADFTSWFEIKYYTHPVLIVVVTSSSALNILTAREDADLFMRDRLRDYAETCSIPILRGISAMGKRMAFYSVDMRNPKGAYIIPLAIPQDSGMMNDTAPRDRWSLDVLSEEGETQIRRIADEIQAECVNLGLK